MRPQIVSPPSPRPRRDISSLSPRPRRGQTSLNPGCRQRRNPGPPARTIPPLSFLLLLLILPSSLAAQQQQPHSPPRNEPPVCFDTSAYRNRQIASYPILQFLGARCAEVTKLPPLGARGLFRYFDAHSHYPEYQRLPLDIYFQPDGAPLEEIYHINTGAATHHITLPMRYEGTYYVVIRDQVKPSVLIVNSVTLKAEFRRYCALTESIIPEYLHR